MDEWPGGDTIGEVIIMKLDEEKRFLKISFYFTALFRDVSWILQGGDTMQFNTSTDYAIQLVLYLAKESKTVSSSKLSAAIGVSSRYLLQISAKLRDADLIEVTYGGNGGFSLLLPAAKITLYDIVIVMEGNIIHKPLTEDTVMQEKFKALNIAYKYMGQILIDILKSITIESLLSQSVEEWYLGSYLIKNSP